MNPSFGRSLVLLVLILNVFPFFCAGNLYAEDTTLQIPKISLNGKPGNVTAQDLSGLGTRPLRLLIQRNNKTRGKEFMQIYALGVNAGDDLSAELLIDTPGTRMTVYKIAQEAGGPRYLSMPASAYFAEMKTAIYQEKIEDLREEFLIFVFEKTGKPDEKNIQIRYFEERVRKLVLASYKTNFFFSSLKLKMKDLGGGETEKFFERDAQLLIDRMDHPQRIILLRLWKAGS